MQRVSRALTMTSHGPPSSVLKVRYIPLEMDKKSMMLQILAAPVNPSDVNMIEGTYPLKPNWITCPSSSSASSLSSSGLANDRFAVAGFEGVARVLGIGAEFERGNLQHFKVGDWVVPINQGFNTWQTHALVHDPALCLKLNDCEGISPIAAATMSVNPPTALRMLKDFASLKRGDVIVQNASNSGVGQAVIQICKAYGYQSVNVIRDRPGVKALMDSLYEMGASLVVLESRIRDEETAAKIAALMATGSSSHHVSSSSSRSAAAAVSGIKLAFNGVGGKSATNLARLLGDQGQLVTYGGMSKEPVTLPTSLFIFKRLEAKGFWLSKWLKERDGQAEANEGGNFLVHRQEMYSELFSLARKGYLREPVHETWDWNKIKDDDALCKIAHFESSASFSRSSSSGGVGSKRGLAASMAPAYSPDQIGHGKRILTNLLSTYQETTRDN